MPVNRLSIARTLAPLGKRSRASIENYRDRKIRELVAHAYAHVPFYRALYDEHGVNPAKVRGFADLPALPFATRQAFQRARPTDLVAEGIDPNKLLVRRTNGTSSEPLGIRRTRAESRVLNQFYFQAFRSIGVGPRDLAVGTALPRPGEPKPFSSLWRRVANRVRLYPTATILRTTPQGVLEELIRLKPEVIGGLPGRLSLLAARWTDEERAMIEAARWPRLVVTGGERLKSQLRAHLSDAFGARVIDMYSSVEFNLIASECLETGRYHVSDETVALEILSETGQTRSGNSGRPVGTALHSFAAPIIRYPLGDRVTAGDDTCACGLNLSTIGEIQGRSMDYFEFPDGTVTHDQKIEEAVAHAADWVRQIQVSQPEPDRIVLRMAPLQTPSSGKIDQLRMYMESYLNHAVTVEVIIDPGLGPEGAAKFVSTIPLRRASSTSSAPPPPTTRAGE